MNAEQAEAKRAYNHAYHAAHRAEVSARRQSRYEAHREEEITATAAYRATHPERYAYSAHPATQRASSRRYYWRHHAEIAEQRQNPVYLARQRVHAASARARDTGAIAARNAVAHAIEHGGLVREPCLRCGAQPAQAHHHNGYEPEHRLDVVWLCSVHHGEAHRMARRAA